MPYWGRSCRKLATLLPSTRALGLVPLAGEVLSDPRERIILSQERTNKSTADQCSYCEVGITLVGEECQRLGEIRVDESLLCARHAELVVLEKHSNMLLGTAFEMDKWLDDAQNRTDELRFRRMLRQRDEVVLELRSTTTQTDAIRVRVTEEPNNSALSKVATVSMLRDG